jgi:hypothetical protein
VDKALGIPWVDGVSVAHIRNDTLPKNTRPVLIEAKNHIKTSATHYLQAPAIQFRVQKEPGSNGLTLGHAKLYLTADFISFDSDVEMKNNAIVLDYLHGVTDEDGKEYGIVHFGGLVYKNSHQHAVKNLAKYYLFEKGTELTADTIPQGLKPLDENSDLFRQVFTFGLKDDPDLLDEQYTFQYASGS